MKITIRNFQKKIPINPKRIKAAILKTLSGESTKKSGEITVCFVTDEKIKELNRKYLHKNKPTDVLVFDMTERKDLKHIFADIVISTGTAVKHARIFRTTRFYELYLYVIHGALHILGYDDKNASQRKVMDKKATQILAQLNLAK